MNSKIISNMSSAEKIMSSGRKKIGAVDDMGSVSKIAAALYYQSAVLEYLVNSRRAQQNVKSRIFSHINKDFGNYTDMQARSYTSRLHHVYEWKRVGQEEARLWKLNKKDMGGYDMSIDYSFKTSRISVPNSGLKKYIFKDKARIMEYRIPVTIRPRTLGGRLAFTNQDGKKIVLPKDRSVRVSMPGGSQVFEGFARTYGRFFLGPMVVESIKSSNVDKAMSRSAKSASRPPSYVRSKTPVNKISPSSIRVSAKSSAERAANRI